ncbi:MAG: hypothetical protein IB618_01055 [Candidatus Pacearchaeota archaeon]|nr:MAG: hypothetical protein IB618_01055 [Candidatus Pacearchaeota archaeon]
MGLVYAQNSIITIIATNEGLTKEEIFEINRQTYRANLDKYWNFVMGLNWINDFVHGKDERFYIKPEIREDIEKHSLLLKIINKSNRPIKKLITKI